MPIRKKHVTFHWVDKIHPASANVVRILMTMDLPPGDYHFDSSSLSRVTGIPKKVIISDDAKLLRRYQRLNVQ